MPRGDARLGGGPINTSPSCPHAGPGVRKVLTRANVVRLVVDRDSERKLRELAEYTAKAWNEVNWLRMQQFKEGVRVDFNGTEKVVYHKYKHYLKANASQVCRKNAEAWRSFFSLAKERKEGKLPRWMKPRPPGYWKGKMVILIKTTAMWWTRRRGQYTSRTSA